MKSRLWMVVSALSLLAGLGLGTLASGKLHPTPILDDSQLRCQRVKVQVWQNKRANTWIDLMICNDGFVRNRLVEEGDGVKFQMKGY